jgi:hypothetical protein
MRGAFDATGLALVKNSTLVGSFVIASSVCRRKSGSNKPEKSFGHELALSQPYAAFISYATYSLRGLKIDKRCDNHETDPQ